MGAGEGAQTPPLPLQPHPGFEPRAGKGRVHDPGVGQMKVSNVGQIRLSNAIFDLYVIGVYITRIFQYQSLFSYTQRRKVLGNIPR